MLGIGNGIKFQALAFGLAGAVASFASSGASADVFVLSGANVPASGAYVYNPLGVTNANNVLEQATFSGNAGIENNAGAWGFATSPDNNPVFFLQSNPGQPSAGACTFTACQYAPLSVANIPGAATLSFSNLTVGANYTLSYDVSGRPGSYGGLAYSVSDGANSFGFTTPSKGWVAQTIGFTAASTSDVFTFAVNNTGADNADGFTAVTLALAPGPTPGAGLAGVAALLLMGAAAKARKIGRSEG